MLARVVKCEVMIERPQGIEPRQCGLSALLPVNPPEFHAVVFVRVIHGFEIRVDIAVVGHVERYVGFRVGIDAHFTRHIFVHVFKMPHAVGGMQVHRHLKSLFVEPFQKAFVVGE